LQLEREEYDIAAGEKDGELQNAAAENESDVKVNVVFLTLAVVTELDHLRNILLTCLNLQSGGPRCGAAIS